MAELTLFGPEGINHNSHSHRSTCKLAEPIEIEESGLIEVERSVERRHTATIKAKSFLDPNGGAYSCSTGHDGPMLIIPRSGEGAT